MESGMKSIVWGNYKGGVGKTISTFQVAAHFANKGKKVLLIDLDPQSSLSHICCTSNDTYLDNVPVNKTLNYFLELYVRFIKANQRFDFDLMTDQLADKIIAALINDGIVQLTKSEFNGNLFFIPSSLHFENGRLNELAQRAAKNIFNLFIIHLLLRDLKQNEEKFDYVFFDCPPTTNLLIQSSFLAADYYIVPTICDEISIRGVPDYIREIEKTASQYNVHENIGAIMLKKVFSNKTKLIGVFETLYKERRGDADNSAQVEALDQDIAKIAADVSMLSDQQYAHLRYPTKENPGIATTHIFGDYIGNRDARTVDKMSISLDTNQGRLSHFYENIAKSILEVL